MNEGPLECEKSPDTGVQMVDQSISMHKLLAGGNVELTEATDGNICVEIDEPRIFRPRGSTSTFTSDTQQPYSPHIPSQCTKTLSDGDSLVKQYHQILAEYKVAKETNVNLQTRLAEYFRRKKADVSAQISTTASTVSTLDSAVDCEQKYDKYIINLMELARKHKDLEASYNKQISELESICQLKEKEANDMFEQFLQYKYDICKTAVYSRTGLTLSLKDLSKLINDEREIEASVMKFRLENIKLKNEFTKLENVLKSKQQLPEGLHLIDFEQLKIESQTYNEKFEEQSSELSKVKKKISTTVQIISHVKQKLSAIQNDNAQNRQLLIDADRKLTCTRDQLTKLKQNRDRLRAENRKLRRSCGLLGKPTLLLNYEDSINSVNQKRKELEEFQQLVKKYEERSENLERQSQSSLKFDEK